MFVILIGPVNYLLCCVAGGDCTCCLVTVPAGAALVTAALFAYALISDGLGVRVRVRGLMEIDQRVGRTVSWSRQSYYAGLAPSQGLRFSERTAVYPDRSQSGWSDVADSRRPSGRCVWDGDQNLVGRLSQFPLHRELLVIDAGPSAGRAADGRGPGADAPTLQVTNQLAATLDKSGGLGQCRTLLLV